MAEPHVFEPLMNQTHQGSSVKMYGAHPAGRRINGGITVTAEHLIIETIRRARGRKLVGFCVVCEGEARVIITLILWEGEGTKGIVKQRPTSDINAWTETPFDPKAIDCNATDILFTFEQEAWRQSRDPGAGNADPVAAYLKKHFHSAEKP